MKDQNQKNEVNQKLLDWLDSYVVDNPDTNLEIAGVCMREALSKFDIRFGDCTKREDQAIILAIYNFVFEAIIDELKKMQDKTPELSIQVGEIVEIGYDNLQDDDSEKQGNFSPFVYDLKGRLEIEKSPDERSVDACARWMSKNMRDYPKLWDNIATKAIKSLNDEVNVPIAQAVIVLPIFALIQSQLCMYMDTMRKDQDESCVMITFASVIDVYAMKMEDNSTDIQFKPKPSMKLGTKSDATATAPEEDED
jgi:hypothetical protein